MSTPITTKREKYSDPWYAKPGMVYFIGAGNPPVAVKIGVTHRSGIRSRLRGLQSSNHEPIKLMGVILFEEGQRPMRAAEEREQELHRQFAYLQRFERGWVGSEWFTCSDELLSFIEHNSVPPEQLGIIATVCKPNVVVRSSGA